MLSLGLKHRNKIQQGLIGNMPKNKEIFILPIIFQTVWLYDFQTICTSKNKKCIFCECQYISFQAEESYSWLLDCISWLRIGFRNLIKWKQQLCTLSQIYQWWKVHFVNILSIVQPFWIRCGASKCLSLPFWARDSLWKSWATQVSWHQSTLCLMSALGINWNCFPNMVWLPQQETRLNLATFYSVSSFNFKLCGCDLGKNFPCLTCCLLF